MPTGPITGEAPNGDYIVGIDIAPGIWQCRSVGDDLYWETSDRAGRIISNDLGAIARVAAEAFAVKLAGCQDDWIAVDAEPASNEAVEVTSSGSGSPARDADIALCQNAFERFSDDLRADLDEAILAGHLSPVNLWFAASTFGSVTVGDASGTIARSIGEFNAAAMLLTQEGVVEMSDEGAQNFMQSYYEMRTHCEDIKAWG